MLRRLNIKLVYPFRVNQQAILVGPKTGIRRYIYGFLGNSLELELSKVQSLVRFNSSERASSPSWKPLKLTDIGEGIADVRIVEWHVSNGANVKEMDKICTVESDKATVVITSEFAGMVENIRYNLFDTVEVGADLCDIVEVQSDSLLVNGKSPVLEVPSNEAGNGPSNDIIVRTDTGINSAMMRSMTKSLSIPHFTICEEFLVTDLIRLVDKHKGSGIKLTTHLLKLISMAIELHPRVNSKLDKSTDFYTVFGSHNISIAVDTPNGLVVPNLKNLQTKGLVIINDELMRMKQDAVKGVLQPSDLKGGTLTFSNIGSIGGVYATPILFDDQSVIVCVGRIRCVPYYRSEAATLTKEYIINVSVSADHRHIDGAMLARFVKTVGEMIMEPDKYIK